MIPKTLLLSLAFASTAFADFYLGSISGEGLSGSAGAGPAQAGQCDYTIWEDGTDICDTQNFNPSDGSGGCPGQAFDAPDWCGMPPSTIGCPSGFVIGTPGGNGKSNALTTLKEKFTNIAFQDDCGASENAAGGGSVPSGTFYANVVDTSNDNAIVGRCVHEYSVSTDCASTGSFVAKTIVHCYMQTGC